MAGQREGKERPGLAALGKRSEKPKKQRWHVRIFGKVHVVDGLGRCGVCGGKVLRSKTLGAWAHAGFLRSEGRRKYDHVARPERRVAP